MKSKLALNLRAIYLITFLFVFIIAISIFTFSPDFYLKSLAIDDALYYPIIARNIAIGNGSTFDNITKTNGYHPLWCWLNIPFSILSNDNMVRLFIFKGLVVIMVLAMLIVWDSLLRKLNLPLLFRSYFLLFMGCGYWWSVKVFYSGMETTLACLLIGLDFHILIEFKKNIFKMAPFLLGLLLGLTFLSRLDTIFLLISIFGSILYFEKKISKKIIIVALSGSFVTLPYLILNLINFRNIIPISGLKKAGMGSITSNMTYFIDFVKSEIFRMIIFLRNIKIIIILGIIILCVLLIFKRNKKILLESSTEFSLTKFKILLPLFTATLLHFIYTLLFMSEMHVNWYQYFIYLSLFLLLSGFLTYIGTRFSIGIIVYPIVLIIFIIMICIGYTKYPRLPSYATIEAAKYAKYHVKRNSIFIMHDPGKFRYVSELRTLAGNGLIGDRSLMELASNNQKNKIIKKYNINYVVDIFSSNDIRKMGDPIFVSRNYVDSGKSYAIAIFEARKYMSLKK